MERILGEAKKRIFVVLVVVSTVIVVLFAAFSSASQKGAPAEFTRARESAASVSREIVDLNGKVDAKISEANAFETAGENNEALMRIEEARMLNNEAYDRAFELSYHLKSLASSLTRVSGGNRMIALEATALDLQLVDEFISYTKNLNSFFDSLRAAIRTGDKKEEDKVSSLLEAINKNAEKINFLNSKFLEKMRIFDSSF